tara:strand:- start:2084 stop:2698 length:615 start_codon:yes stop_codon:yes gene_type:complete
MKGDNNNTPSTVRNLGSLQPPDVPQFDPEQILKNIEKRSRDQGFDLEDPGYIEYYNEVKRFLDSRSLNTYGDCEITILWGKTMQDQYHDVKPEEAQLDMFQATMVFIKPDQILTDVLEQCRVKVKSKVGILVSGNVKDTKKEELTEKQIEEDYVVISGVKPRSKYIQIWVDEEIGDYSSENPFCQDHLQHLERFPLPEEVIEES